jgi:hypothetical protein
MTSITLAMGEYRATIGGPCPLPRKFPLMAQIFNLLHTLRSYTRIMYYRTCRQRLMFNRSRVQVMKGVIRVINNDEI